MILSNISIPLVGITDTVITGHLKNPEYIASIAVAVWSGIASFIILIILKRTIGIRVSPEEEEAGLDVSSHSESAYN